MHTQASDKQIACKEFFQALQACHQSSWRKWTGGCNEPKHKLNMCLRKERTDRAAKNRDEAKHNREKTKQAWKELHQDD
ncbi:hypothetical protein OE88DRAFT_1028583 [Heliocybe sulcata]|uniref:COX assembly mitochondrial protein n=1 Tax=Heliocybe sulcata TaxID=5364 RepID=A0A5C3NE71_9AGAM|nr:hypothetical protein OE88DRAFT_1028583 [Heliocybe sulcata]